MNKDVIDHVNKTTIFSPTFINSLQDRMYRFMAKFPKGQKFRIIIEPIETKKSDDEEVYEHDHDSESIKNHS